MDAKLALFITSAAAFLLPAVMIYGKQELMRQTEIKRLMGAQDIDVKEATAQCDASWDHRKLYLHEELLKSSMPSWIMVVVLYVVLYQSDYIGIVLILAGISMYLIHELVLIGHHTKEWWYKLLIICLWVGLYMYIF